jgi:hypothetical protein
MPTNLDATNTWLAVMAVAIVVQTLVLIGIAVGLWLAASRLGRTLEELEARHLAPLSARVSEVSARVTAVADDVQDVMGRLRRADDAVRSQLGRLDTAAHVAGSAIGSKVWPVVGLSRAVAAAVRAFSSRSSTPSSGPARVVRVTTP